MQAKGRDQVLEILESEGVRHVFGNPGTTEMPLVDALSRQSKIDYVLGLHESTVIGMADGYAQLTGRPAFVNLHAAGGLGNAMGNITNARANHAPLVITAGQQDMRHLVLDPLLAGDLVSMPKEWVKSSCEARSTLELGVMLRRAFTLANLAPSGPTFVSMPMNLLDEDCAGPTPPRSVFRANSAPVDIDALAQRLLSHSPGRIAFVMGDEARSDSTDALVRLASAHAASVYGAPLHGRLTFPTDHPLWAGALPFSADKIRETLKPFDCVVFFGDQAFLVYIYSEGSPLPEGVDFVHVAADATQLGKAYATNFALHADPALAIVQLALACDAGMSAGRRADADAALAGIRKARIERDAEQSRRTDQRGGRSPMDPMSGVRAAMSPLKGDTLVVDEAITASAYVRGSYKGGTSGFFACRGGGLGWGMPAAVGVSLGAGRAPTACLVGDGSAMYSPQAMWSAAQMGLPVVFIVVNNTEYRILKQYGNRAYDAKGLVFKGLDLKNPSIDFPSLARAMGVKASRATTEAEAADAVAAALDSAAPTLVELVVSP